MRLSSNDLVALLDTVHGLYGWRTSSALGDHLCRTVRTLVPAENSTYSELTPRGPRPTAVEYMEPAGLLTPAVTATFERLMAGHPVIAHYLETGDGHARKVSDFVSQRQLHRLEFYNEYVRPFFGLEYQIAMAMTATPDRVVGISLARSRRDFSERDRLMLDLLRPHVVQARRTTELVERMAHDLDAFTRGLDASATGLIQVGPGSTIRSATTCARRWLCRYFNAPPAADRLPDLLQRWMRCQQDAEARAGDAPPPRTPLVTTRDGHELSIRWVPDGSGDLLLLDERRGLLDRTAFDGLGLTAREADVLVWVGAGKTNAEVGAILGARPRTVEKHLERIYRKLGVENRTTAAGVARDRVGVRRLD